jgi:lipoprotein NlpI
MCSVLSPNQNLALLWKTDPLGGKMRNSIVLMILGMVAVLPAHGQRNNDVELCKTETNVDSALSHCTAAINSVGLSTESLATTFHFRGDAYMAKGNLDLAIQDFSQAIRLNPNLAEAFNNRGNAYAQKHDYDRAIQDLNEFIRVMPNFAGGFDNRGIAYLGKGEYDRAIQDFNQAIQLKPSAEPFAHRGEAYAHKGEYERAIQDLNDSIRLKPSYAYAFSARGNAYKAKGDSDRAIDDYSVAILLNPSDPPAFTNRGNAYMSKGNPDLAIQDYSQAIQLDPNFYQPFSGRGEAYSDKGEYNRAIEDYNQAIRLNPNYAGAFQDRGRAQFFLGHFSAAALDLVKAQDLDPKDPYSSLWLYLAHSRAEQEARNELGRSATSLDLTKWPSEVIRLYLGQATPESVLAAATNSDARTDREQHCEAYFYLGQYALLAGKQQEAASLFQQAINTRVITFVEYTSAQAELKRLALVQQASAVGKKRL